MKELAARMKYALRMVPIAAIQMVSRWTFLAVGPAEDPQAQEGRFQEEGQQSLERQRGAEDVADEARVRAPVHPELELLHDPGDHAHREVDQEELAEDLVSRRYFSCRSPPGGLKPATSDAIEMVTGTKKKW